MTSQPCGLHRCRDLRNLQPGLHHEKRCDLPLNPSRRPFFLKCPQHPVEPFGVVLVRDMPGIRDHRVFASRQIRVPPAGRLSHKP